MVDYGDFQAIRDKIRRTKTLLSTIKRPKVAKNNLEARTGCSRRRLHVDDHPLGGQTSTMAPTSPHVACTTQLQACLHVGLGPRGLSARMPILLLFVL